MKLGEIGTIEEWALRKRRKLLDDFAKGVESKDEIDAEVEAVRRDVEQRRKK